MVAGPGLVIEPPALAVAGSYHTATSPIELGVPMGAGLTRQRPGIRAIRISYGSGHFYNGGSRRFHPSHSPQRQVRLCQRRGELILDLPSAGEAVVPHRPQPWPMLAKQSP